MMDLLRETANLVSANCEWIFSGAGVTAVLVLFAVFRWLFTRKKVTHAYSQVSAEQPKRAIVSRMKLAQDRGSIRVGFLHYPPLISSTAAGNPSGIYAELTTAVFAGLGLSVDWIQITLPDAIKFLNNGKLDCVTCIFQTAERARQADFAAFLHTVSVTGIVRSSNHTLRTQADLQKPKFKIAVCRHEIGHEIAERILQIPSKRLLVLESPDVSRVGALVQTGAADIAIADGISCKRFVSENPNASPKLRQIFLSQPLAVCFNGVMVPRDQPDLRNTVERGFRNVTWPPELRALENDVIEDYHGVSCARPNHAVNWSRRSRGFVNL